MSATPAGIVRKGGITRTVFVISLIVVGAGAGLGGYFLNALLNPSVPTITLSGAGSSLVYPILSTWTSNYHGLHSNIQINYQSIGSGAGVTDFQQKVVDFAGTDAAPDANTLAGMNTTLTIPETIGAITLAYNIPSFPTGLQLNETIIARIFSANSTISTWNDPAIKALNPALASSLPSNSIQTVHRADSSGTTFIFEGYLRAAGAPIWIAGQSKSWPSTGVAPNALAGNQNTGVATDVLNTPYSIGYVEVAYALANSMKVAYVQNKDRTEFVQPTLANITSAVANANTGNLPTGLQSWSTVSMTLEPGANSYPIVGLTYILVYQNLNVLPLMNLNKAKALVDFIWYVVHTGQSASGSLEYATLPQSIVTIDETSIQSITFSGQTLPT